MIYKKIVVGVLFFLSAIFKMLDFSATVAYFNSFIKLPSLIMQVSTALLILGELILVYLLFNFKTTFVIPLFLGMLLFFVGLNIYMIIQNYENCGCFGTMVKMHPMVTLVKNLILIYLLIDIKRSESAQYAN